MQQTIEIHIDKLVLHGFAPHQRHHINAAVQAELHRLFAEQGIPQSLQQGGSIAIINAGSFNMQPVTQPATVGNNIANTVYKKFANEKRSSNRK